MVCAMPQLRGYTYAGVSLRFGKKILLLWNAQRESWELPGGTVEDTDQTYLAAALRELAEEAGIQVDGAPAWVMGTAPMQTPGAGAVFGFNIDRAELPPQPVLSEEHTEYGWFDIDALPEQIHTVCIHPILRWKYTEIDLYKLIQRGVVIGPNSYFNQVLFPVRVTGTGVAFRLGEMQYTFRDPKDYLTPEFVERVNGLPLLWKHAQADLINGKTMAQQSIGNVVSPWIKGDEVWGVGRVVNLDAATSMATGAYSTSPSFITAIESRSNEGGIELTIEGQTMHLDHLAVVDMGVWDKLGEPSGIDAPITLRPIPLTFLKEYTMDDVVPAADATVAPAVDANEERFKKLEDICASMKDSMTALCDALMSKKDTVAKPAEVLADGAEGTPAPLMEGASFGDQAPLPGDGATQDAVTTEAFKHAMSAKDAVIAAQQKQLDALASSMPKDLSDDDRNALSEAESRADAIFLAFGKSAPRPLMNENHLPYRRRIAKTLQPHSKRFKSMNLSVLDAASFGSIEAEIYKDALDAARSPEGMPPNSLMPVKRRSFGNREIIEWRGSPRAFLAPFSQPPRRAKEGRYERRSN